MLPSGSPERPFFKASMIMMKTAPKSCPAVQQMVDEISGLTGWVMSTRYSSAHGKRENDVAPKSEQITYGPGSERVCGIQIKERSTLR